MSKRALVVGVTAGLLALLVQGRAMADPIISPGTPTTTVPTYLCNSPPYPFPTALCPLTDDEFLLPIQISGAVNLQAFQFTLLFDNNVVNEVDSLPDFLSGIYGAEFVNGNVNSLSSILSGFPLNFLGEVDSVAGAYPSLLTGPSGNGILAFILFEPLPNQDIANANFTIQGASVLQGAAVPEPATIILLLSGLAALGSRRLVSRKAA